MTITHGGLILASASTARAQLLKNAGVVFTVEKADIDERLLEREYFAGKDSSPDHLPLHLARAKAGFVAGRRSDALVLGADQVLVHEGRILGKPPTINDARRQLQSLRGNTHELVSALSLVRGASQLWSASVTTALTMRNFSNDFLENYLRDAGRRCLQSVGAYQVEGPAIQMFEAIDGDYFSILGLPLLPLLGALRDHGVIPR
jgi:septum formation protein